MKKAKRMFSIILAFTIVLSLPMYCLANSGLSAATSLSSGSYYYIKNKNSELYLDAENDGSFNVVQYNYHGALNQAWNGFARYMAKKVYGSDIPSWTPSVDPNSLYFVKPGDYIRYDGHSVFVVDIKPDIYTILVVECNYGPDCIIKWYREISIYDIMDTFTHIYKSPYVFVS